MTKPPPPPPLPRGADRGSEASPSEALPPEASGSGVSGVILRDPDWLARQVDGSERQWGTADRRTAAVLWWYSVSTVLLVPPLESALGGVLDPADDATGPTDPADPTAGVLPFDPSPEAVRLDIGAAGRPLTARPTRRTTGPGQFAPALRRLLTTCVDGLVRVAPVKPRPLWAIASDSLGNVLLRAGQERDRVERACALAAELADRIGGPLPRPRFTEVPVPDGSHGLLPPPPPGAPTSVRFLRRSSCCLIYRLPAEDMCVSCPGRSPQDRRVRLESTAARMVGAPQW